MTTTISKLLGTESPTSPPSSNSHQGPDLIDSCQASSRTSFTSAATHLVSSSTPTHIPAALFPSSATNYRIPNHTWSPQSPAQAQFLPSQTSEHSRRVEPTQPMISEAGTPHDGPDRTSGSPRAPDGSTRLPYARVGRQVSPPLVIGIPYKAQQRGESSDVRPAETADGQPAVQKSSPLRAASRGGRKVHTIGPYRLLQTIGQGEFGKVKLAFLSETGQHFAIKLFRRPVIASDESKISKLKREIRILRSIEHPNVVRLRQVIETRQSVGLVFEYASGGELFDFILSNHYLEERVAHRLFMQLIDGVSYLHQLGIVHRDLKLENLLISRDGGGDLVIIDFGFANTFKAVADESSPGETLMRTSCGSPCYAAPELALSRGYKGTAADIWSCGIILYAMGAGYLPFNDDPLNPDSENVTLLYKYILSVPTPLRFPPYFSEELSDLLRKLISPDPKRRARMIEILNHKWMKKFPDGGSKRLRDNWMKRTQPEQGMRANRKGADVNDRAGPFPNASFNNKSGPRAQRESSLPKVESAVSRRRPHLLEERPGKPRPAITSRPQVPSRGEKTLPGFRRVKRTATDISRADPESRATRARRLSGCVSCEAPFEAAENDQGTVSGDEDANNIDILQYGKPGLTSPGKYSNSAFSYPCGVPYLRPLQREPTRRLVGRGRTPRPREAGPENRANQAKITSARLDTSTQEHPARSRSFHSNRRSQNQRSQGDAFFSALFRRNRENSGGLRVAISQQWVGSAKNEPPKGLRRFLTRGRERQFNHDETPPKGPEAAKGLGEALRLRFGRRNPSRQRLPFYPLRPGCGNGEADVVGSTLTFAALPGSSGGGTAGPPRFQRTSRPGSSGAALSPGSQGKGHSGESGQVASPLPEQPIRPYYGNFFSVPDLPNQIQQPQKPPIHAARGADDADSEAKTKLGISPTGWHTTGAINVRSAVERDVLPPSITLYEGKVDPELLTGLSAETLFLTLQDLFATLGVALQAANPVHDNPYKLYGRWSAQPYVRNRKGERLNGYWKPRMPGLPVGIKGGPHSPQATSQPKGKSGVGVTAHGHRLLFSAVNLHRAGQFLPSHKSRRGSISSTRKPAKPALPKNSKSRHMKKLPQVTDSIIMNAIDCQISREPEVLDTRRYWETKAAYLAHRSIVVKDEGEAPRSRSDMKDEASAIRLTSHPTSDTSFLGSTKSHVTVGSLPGPPEVTANPRTSSSAKLENAIWDAADSTCSRTLSTQRDSAGPPSNTKHVGRVGKRKSSDSHSQSPSEERYRSVMPGGHQSYLDTRSEANGSHESFPGPLLKDRKPHARYTRSIPREGQRSPANDSEPEDQFLPEKTSSSTQGSRRPAEDNVSIEVSESGRDLQGLPKRRHRNGAELEGDRRLKDPSQGGESAWKPFKAVDVTSRGRHPLYLQDFHTRSTTRNISAMLTVSRVLVFSAEITRIPHIRHLFFVYLKRIGNRGSRFAFRLLRQIMIQRLRNSEQALVRRVQSQQERPRSRSKPDSPENRRRRGILSQPLSCGSVARRVDSKDPKCPEYPMSLGPAGSSPIQPSHAYVKEGPHHTYQLEPFP